MESKLVGGEETRWAWVTRETRVAKVLVAAFWAEGGMCIGPSSNKGRKDGLKRDDGVFWARDEGWAR